VAETKLDRPEPAHEMLRSASEISLDRTWQALTAQRLGESPAVVFRILQEVSFASFVKGDRHAVSEEDTVLGGGGE